MKLEIQIIFVYKSPSKTSNVGDSLTNYLHCVLTQRGLPDQWRTNEWRRVMITFSDDRHREKGV